MKMYCFTLSALLLATLMFSNKAGGQGLSSNIENKARLLMAAIDEFDNGNATFNFSEIRVFFRQMQTALIELLLKINGTQSRIVPTATFARTVQLLELAQNISERSANLSLLRQGTTFVVKLPSAQESANNHRQFNEILLKLLRCRYHDKCYRKLGTLSTALTAVCRNAENAIHPDPDYVQTTCIGIALDATKRYAALGIAISVEAAIAAFVELPACGIALRTGSRDTAAEYSRLTECLRQNNTFPFPKTANRTTPSPGSQQTALLGLAAENDNVSASIHALALTMEHLPLDALAVTCGAVFGSSLGFIAASPLKLGLALNVLGSSETFKFFRKGQNFYEALWQVRTAANGAFEKFEGMLWKMRGLPDDGQSWASGIRRIVWDDAKTAKDGVQFLKDRQRRYMTKVQTIISELPGPKEALSQLQEMVFELTMLYARAKRMSADDFHTIRSRQVTSQEMLKSADKLLLRVDTDHDILTAWMGALRMNQSVWETLNLSIDWLASVVHSTRPLDDLVVYENPLNWPLRYHVSEEDVSFTAILALGKHDSEVIPASILASSASRFAESTTRLRVAVQKRGSDDQLREYLAAGKHIVSWLQAVVNIDVGGRVVQRSRQSRLRQLLAEAAEQLGKCGRTSMTTTGCPEALEHLAVDADVIAAELAIEQPSILLPRWLQDARLLDTPNARNEFGKAAVSTRVLERFETDNKKFVEEKLTPYHAKVTKNMDNLRAVLNSINSSTDGKILKAFTQASDALEILLLYLANTGFLAKAFRFQLHSLSETFEYATLVENSISLAVQQNSSVASLLHASLASALMKQAHRIDVIAEQCSASGERLLKHANLRGPMVDMMYIAGPKEALQVLDASTQRIAKTKAEFEAVSRNASGTLVQQKQSLQSVQERAIKILASDA